MSDDGSPEPATPGVVSVVIPTFNRRDALRAVIEPLLGDAATAEVIVVDDGSSDGSSQLLQEWSGVEPRLRVIVQENAGQAAARQRGLEVARGEVVLFLDDDVTAGEGLVSGHAAHHRDARRRLVLGYMPTRLPAPREPGQVATFLYADDYERTCRGYEVDPSTILIQLWSGNLSMRTADARSVGLDTDRRLPYHEDMLFGIRCADAGVEGSFDRRLASSHRHRATLTRFRADARASGAARAMILGQYPQLRDQIHPLAALSAPDRAALRLLGARGVATVTAPLFAAASKLAGALHAWGVETAAARVMRQIELYDEFRRATA
jgi:glycosyltransferase involved in cell wall biosynthesis